MGSTVMSGFWHPGSVSFLGINIEIENILRNVLFLILGFISWKVTTKKIRQENDFSWGPILEVAKLFAGIFVTIIPAIAILKAGDKGSLGFLMAAVTQPAHYFWASGALSSFLDNAPTYLTFFNSAVGAFVVPLYGTLPDPVSVKHLIAENHKILLAISAGSVFMGANTYIGNAPNFMVKSIAEEAGVEMPSFFGYIFKYSLIFLIPVFILVTLVFF
jgi:Na+/H+ antiporter NhaD/arsenite permease-like protein